MNGVASVDPAETIQIRPVCSTTNSRPLPSPAFVTSTGWWKPARTRFSESATFVGSNAATAAGATTPSGPGAATDPSAAGASLVRVAAGPAPGPPPAPIETSSTAATVEIRFTRDVRVETRPSWVTIPPPTRTSGTGDRRPPDRAHRRTAGNPDDR